MARGEWRPEALRLKEEGLSMTEIAARLGRPYNTIRGFFEIRHDTFRVGDGKKILHRKPRQIPKRPVDVMEVARAFARGEIDRFELSRRLKGEAA